MPAGVVMPKDGDVQRPGAPTPCILHLDSLSGNHSGGKLANSLRLYLSFEWHIKVCEGARLPAAARERGGTRWPPSLPLPPARSMPAPRRWPAVNLLLWSCCARSTLPIH